MDYDFTLFKLGFQRFSVLEHFIPLVSRKFVWRGEKKNPAPENPHAFPKPLQNERKTELCFSVVLFCSNCKLSCCVRAVSYYII